MPFSHYKHRSGQPRGAKPCLLCPLTHGPTTLVHLGYGEVIWLCPAHASRDFRVSREGRDMLLSVMLESQAAGAWTKRRSHALTRFLATDGYTAPPGPRPRPGSYAWPDVRRAVEELCRRGEVSMRRLLALVEQATRAGVKGGWMRAPSVRTIRRWREERRWELDGWVKPDKLPRGF